jgi:choline dehydrogenase-like flavoprotein
VATHLAEGGLRVLLLEEGPHVPPVEYQRFEPSESVRRLFREAGMLVALPDRHTPVMTVAVGRAVGGSSILTGGVCFRIPSEVHHRWTRELRLESLSEQALEPAYLDVEQRLAPLEVPETLRSDSTRAFVEGARRLGIAM